MKTLYDFTCPRCGRAFTAWVPKRKFCSRECRNVSRELPVTSRLWRGVVRVEGCWARPVAAAGKSGHTKIRIGDRRVYAHRAAWEEATGETLSSDVLICHACDNPPCIRNDEVGVYVLNGVAYPRRGHLFKAPSPAVNNADKMKKGRAVFHRGAEHWTHSKPERIARGDLSGASLHPETRPRGSRHWLAKLTEDQVRMIRERYAAGGVTQAALGADYGVTHYTVSLIVKRKIWQHVE